MNFLEKFETQSKEETIKFLSEQLGLRALKLVSEEKYDKQVSKYTTSTFTSGQNPEGEIYSFEQDPETAEARLGLSPGSLKQSSTGYSNSFIVNGPDGTKHSIYNRSDALRIRPISGTGTTKAHTNDLLAHLSESMESVSILAESEENSRGEE